MNNQINNKVIIIAIILSTIFIGLLYWLWIMTTGKDKIIIEPVVTEAKPQPKPVIPVLDCLAGPFMREVVQGSQASWLIKDNIFLAEESYEFELGDLPQGVSGKIEGNLVELVIGEQASPASYSLVIVIKKPRSDGSIGTSFCPYNLVVIP